jgi:hypothetical protein
MQARTRVPVRQTEMETGNDHGADRAVWGGGGVRVAGRAPRGYGGGVVAPALLVVRWPTWTECAAAFALGAGVAACLS